MCSAGNSQLTRNKKDGHGLTMPVFTCLLVYLLINPRINHALIAEQFVFVEPQGQLLGGGFRAIGAVNNVEADVHTKIRAD